MQKKNCIVSFCNIYVLPYAKTYIDAIHSHGDECTLLFWDRDAVEGRNDELFNCDISCYQKLITPQSKGSEKIKGYFGAVQYFRKVLKKKHFDGIIFLQTHAAISCTSLLLKHYKKRYIVDIRDYTLENIGLYRAIESSLIKNSYASIISSPAYADFLPPHEYVVAHNYSPFDKSEICSTIEKRNTSGKGCIRISFVGTVRFIDMDKRILRLFANDGRFHIGYYGTGSQVLEEYCKNERITNASFCGSFSPAETLSFYETTDMINNLYGNNDKFLDYALSNKLYHAAQLQIPILVCPNTYMEQIATEYNMGYVLDVTDSLSPDKLYSWFHSLDFDLLSAGADKFLKKVKADNEKYIQVIHGFICSEEDDDEGIADHL